ncbi:MAG: bifunctional methylenetetrahydrofolate dehydrogenase/methenyltetrahydrofolate cyclohydrolase FolD [bacterium]
MFKLIDGKARAKEIRETLKSEVSALKAKGINPKLTVVLVGDDPASHIYVSNKEKACAEVGILSEAHRLPANTRESDLIKLVEKLNKDKTVHGILVQLPMPDHIVEENVINSILPSKDVDGLGMQNMGLLVKGEGDPLIPCTPQGVMDLIHSTGIEVKGKHAVVVGRSNLVGKPAAILLLREHATVTQCHSRTVDLGAVTRQADILVAAIGKSKLITADMVKPGAVVIDVGTVRTAAGLSGDVDFEKVKEVAGFITPVPGGVGPMTIAMLLKNTLKAASK